MTRRLGKTTTRKQLLAAIYRYRDACTSVITTRLQTDAEIDRAVELELSNAAMRMLALIDRLFPADRPVAQVSELLRCAGIDSKGGAS